MKIIKALIQSLAWTLLACLILAMVGTGVYWLQLRLSPGELMALIVALLIFVLVFLNVYDE